MQLPLYLSSGAFTGRINGRNPALLFEAAKVFPVAGFELMVFDELYSPAPTLFPAYREAGIRIPLLHADKKIGDFMSLPDGEVLAGTMLDAWVADVLFAPDGSGLAVVNSSTTGTNLDHRITF